MRPARSWACAPRDAPSRPMGRLNHFERVRSLVAGCSGVPVAEITPETRLVEDLGIDGDDGHEFLEAFADEFGVDMSGMSPFNYFDDEPPLGMASGLIALIAIFSPRFRAYARHAARGRRALTVRSLVTSARARRCREYSPPSGGSGCDMGLPLYGRRPGRRTLRLVG